MLDSTQILDFVDETVSGGYVLAIALVCLMQYLLSIYRIAEARRQTDRYRREMEGIESELQDVQKDRTLARLENQILREFVSETEIQRALDLLMRRFVPNPKDGFSGLIQMDSGGDVLVRSRGLSDASKENLVVDPELIERVMRERVIVLEGSQLFGTRLLGSLSRSDRGKTRQVYLIAVGGPDEISSIMLTTSLYPIGGARQQQIELAKRLMFSLAGNLKQSQALEQKDHELRSTSEMLELRSIIDREFDTPLLMIEAFLDCLREKISADRGALYLSNQTAEGATRALIRCGPSLQGVVQQRWFDHEDLLVDFGLGQQSLSTLGERELGRIGIATLFGSAVVAPLIQRDATIGAVCFTRKSRERFSKADLELAAWAVDHLAETILRALSRATVERQARLDALTGLANRRTFDEIIGRVVQTAADTGGECSLLLFDIDRFKSINDTHGHPAGDEVLRSISRILRDEVSQIRSNDRALSARYGGEEFAVLLPGVGVAGANRIADSIRAAVEQTTVDFDVLKLRVTLSAGLATYPTHAQSVAQLIAASDAGLYEAKQSGRNRVACVEKLPV